MKSITKEVALSLLVSGAISIIQRVSFGDVPVTVSREQAETDFINHGSGFVDLTESPRQDGMKIGFYLDDGAGRKFTCLAA